MIVNQGDGMGPSIYRGESNSPLVQLWCEREVNAEAQTAGSDPCQDSGGFCEVIDSPFILLLGKQTVKDVTKCLVLF